MENSISEEEKKDEGTPERTSENDAPQSLFRKALPWGVFALLVVVATALVRTAFLPDYYEKYLALIDSTSDFEVTHSIKCVVKLWFSLVWVGLFFTLLRKLPLWARGLLLILFFWSVPLAIYLRKYYGMEIDSSFVMDCLNTHWEEARAFISFHAIATLLLFVVAMFAVAWLIGKVHTRLFESKIFIGGLLLAFVILTALPQSRFYIFPLTATIEVKNSLQDYKESQLGFELLVKQENEPQEVERVPAEISHVNAVPIVVLHIAESARADHAPFNGYARNTMPNMLREAEAGNLVSFPKCVSFSVKTVLSMLGMMSPSTVLDNAFRHPTFIPALNQSDVETCGFLSESGLHGDIHDMWIGQILSRIQEIVSTQTSALALLPEIREKLAEDAKKEPPQERFYLYYGEGSHTPFTHYDYDRYAVFKPTGDRIYNDERDVNNYDNTFVAVDEFCGGFIDTLRNENAVYIFVGDHGTMLGEDGLQGRPFKRKEARHVLFFVWASEKFKAENPELWATLVRNHERLDIISHDFVYNSVLHLFSLKTPFYDEKADLFSDSAEPFPTEMPEAEFGPMRFGENAPLDIEAFKEKWDSLPQESGMHETTAPRRESVQAQGNLCKGALRDVRDFAVQ